MLIVAGFEFLSPSIKNLTKTPVPVHNFYQLPSVRKICRLEKTAFISMFLLHFFRSVLLYGSECWAIRKEDKARLERNDQAMLRWICGVKFSDRVSVDSLYQSLGIAPLTTLLRSRRLRWFGHFSRSEGWINQCHNLDVKGKRG